MSLALVLLLQSAAPASAPPPSAKLIPLDFDLKDWRPSESCDPDSAGEIIVCGRRMSPDRFRIGPLSSQYDSAPPVAEIGIGGGAKVGAWIESVASPGGQVSKRLMIGLKMPF